MPIIKHKEQLHRIVANLESFNPEKIILFGSHARGNPKEDSDFDLFIIKQTKKDPSRRAYEARRYLNNINEAFDILVFTPQEVQKRLALNDFFIRDIIEKGQTIYEKA